MEYEVKEKEKEYKKSGDNPEILLHAAHLSVLRPIGIILLDTVLFRNPFFVAEETSRPKRCRENCTNLCVVPVRMGA
jgi:hypothetical protein